MQSQGARSFAIGAEGAHDASGLVSLTGFSASPRCADVLFAIISLTILSSEHST